MAIQTVTEQVYCKLKQEILAQDIPTGEKLTIKMLQNRYGVSSSPIREALAHLQQDGLVEYRPNVGMSVITMTEEDLNEIFELEEEFNCMVLRLAMAKPRSQELLRELESIQKKTEAFIDDDLWLDMSDDFHLKFFDYADNSRISGTAAKFHCLITFFSFTYEQGMENRVSITAEHGEILDALKAGDVYLAEQRMHAHLKSSREKALDVFNQQQCKNSGR